MAKQNTVNCLYTDTILNKLGYWTYKARWGSIPQGVPGLNQKFKKWDTATHEAVADAAALRLVVAADRADSMIVPMAGATPEIYVFSATNTDADDGVTTICPADITHPAPGRWVKRSEAGGATTMVTETLAAVAADLVMVSGGTDRTIVATTIDKGDLVTNATGAAAAAELVLVSAGADKTAKPTTLDYRYNFPRVLVSGNLTIGAGGSTETAFAVPAKCLIKKGWFEVITPVVGQTIDMGITGYDLDGIIAAGSVNATGYIDGPLGVKMPDDFLVSTGLNFSVTGGAAAAGAVVKAFVEIVEMA
jgi:hypothetical protein